MCRKRWVLLVLGLSCARALTGQDLPRLEARADSLAREWRRATAVADAIDSLERARVFAGHDTIRVGALTIVTNASPLPLRAAAARAWPLIDSVYGDAARQLQDRPYVIVPVNPDTTIERPVWHNGTEIPWDQDVVSLTLLLLSTVPIAPADTALQGWLGGPVRPIIRADVERADVYVRLVTAPSEASRRCLIGDIGACRDALDLLGRGDRLARGYPSARERRSLLNTFTPYYFDRGTQQPMLRACAEGNDSACTELLRSLPPGALPRPLTYDARATLVADALRLGGRVADPVRCLRPAELEMARELRWWLAGAFVACAVVAVSYLSPSGIAPAAAARQREPTAARLRARRLAERWRAADLAVRLAVYRRRLEPELAHRRETDQPGPALLVDAPDTVPASTKALVAAALDTVWRELGLGVSKVAVGVVVDFWRIPRTGTDSTPKVPSGSVGYR